MSYNFTEYLGKVRYKVLYFRKGDIIIPADEKGKPNYDMKIGMGSFNKAKKRSREIQKANGGLGMGSVRVLS